MVTNGRYVKAVKQCVEVLCIVHNIMEKISSKTFSILLFKNILFNEWFTFKNVLFNEWGLQWVQDEELN